MQSSSGTAHVRRRVARGGLVAGLAFAFVPIIGISPAHACSCAMADDKTQFKNADAVFKATLPGNKATGNGSPDDVTLTFHATTAYKGTVVARQKVRTNGQGAACGLELSGAGPFLVFASRPYEGDEGKKAPPAKDPAKQVYVASLCGGTRPIAADEEPSFGPGKPVAQPAAQPVTEPAGDGDGDRGGAYGLFAAALGTIMAVLGGLLGWGSRR